MKTEYRGIDYGMGQTNVDPENNIRYGVIPFHDVLQAWCDSSEGYYGEPDTVECPECGADCKAKAWGEMVTCECGEEFSADLPDMAEPISRFYDGDGYAAEQGNDSPDIFITKAPYFTRAQFCSPCAPGACYLKNPCDDGERAYCFGHDWFEGGKAPYPVYSVETGELVNPA
jgi:hypothetical protein